VFYRAGQESGQESKSCPVIIESLTPVGVAIGRTTPVGVPMTRVGVAMTPVGVAMTPIWVAGTPVGVATVPRARTPVGVACRLCPWGWP
jgi:hypothetical protein